MALPLKSTRGSLIASLASTEERPSISSPEAYEGMETKCLRRMSNASHFALLSASTSSRQSSELMKNVKAELGKRRRQLDWDVSELLDVSDSASWLYSCSILFPSHAPAVKIRIERIVTVTPEVKIFETQHLNVLLYLCLPVFPSLLSMHPPGTDDSSTSCLADSELELYI
eukprot:gene20986-27843_t